MMNLKLAVNRIQIFPFFLFKKNGEFLFFLSFLFFLLATSMFVIAKAYGSPSPLTPGTAGIDLPAMSLSFKSNATADGWVNTLRIVASLTVLSLAPSILILMTSFTRIIVVLSFLKQALGLQQMPPSQLLIGLALFLTYFVMQPTIENIRLQAYDPYTREQITGESALGLAEGHLRSFMLKQTRPQDLQMFVELSRLKKIESIEAVPTYVVVPSFIVSELKSAFQIGFVLYLPFLVLDMIVASVLMAMGMMMLPPVVISLPFKLLLFILVDGWDLVITGLVKSFH